MAKKYTPQYPMIWQKKDFFIKIFCSIPNVATGILLTTDNSAFVIDPGDGILRDLTKEIGPKEIKNISDVFISHGHHDHVGGVWSFLTYLSVMRKKTPLNIYFPEGCAEIWSIYKAFNSVYGHEVSYKINMIPISETKAFTRKSVKIKPFKVNHREVAADGSSELVPSLGYKFTYQGKSICYGGDTAYCDSLVQMSKGSDLAIIEAGAKDDKKSELHMTMDEASKIGEKAKEYFLVHVPEN